MSFKRKDSSIGERLKKARIEELIPIVPIQATPIPKSNVAAPRLALPDEAAPSTSLEQEEVAKKRKKKEKNTIIKKVKRKVGSSDDESSSQEQDSLDDREVIQSLIRDSILPYITDKMV
ncbi:hypothetical protein COCNU_scaffold004624G000020 [Cocos nucifera]|nr:hypothetical protein [Cocos nucifera]